MTLIHMNFHSHALGMACSCDVLLPTTMQYPKAQEKKTYPVLYLLHGLKGDDMAWQRRTRIESYAEGRDLIIVMPNGHRTYYTNTATGQKFFDFVADELPAICKAYFPVSDKREETFVAGLSMGGHGALKLGLTYPERYGAVAALSAAVDVEGIVERHPGKNGALSEYEYVFGCRSERTGGKDDLTALGEKLRTADVEKPIFFMACGTEDGLLEESRRFHQRFADVFDITYVEAPGIHNWDFWDTHIQDVLNWLPLPAGDA